MYVAAVFAASLSTLAGMVLVMAGSLTRDVILLLKPSLSDRRALLLARGLVAVFALIPLTWVVVKPPDLLAYLMSGAAVGMGCIFFFVLAMTLYWRGAHKYGALACMAYGFAMTALGGYYVYTVNEWGWGNWWWATFVGCAATYFGFSLLGRRVEEKRSRELHG
jgi:Na+/proline symporter